MWITLKDSLPQYKEDNAMRNIILVFLAVNIVLFAGVSVENTPVNHTNNRLVAITFDDLPVNAKNHKDIKTWKAITTGIIKTISSYKIPAVGFVVEGKLFQGNHPDPARVKLLRMWLDAGLELGNHTFSHLDLHKVSLSQFKDDVTRGEKIIKKLLEEKGMKLEYFRHPFLHTGRDLETKKKLEDFLKKRGYRIAPVTIDNSEWIFASAYDHAAKVQNQQMMQRLGKAYVSYMERVFQYYEKQSVDLLGYEIPQVLLLHANKLNAHYFEDLVKIMKKRGYKFISLQTALKDPAYQSADTYTGTGGITWLHRWALTQGKRGKFFAGEPQPPAFVLKEAGVDLGGDR
jgi:peptidoglycan/xylan/chitin deacetylase (PgdA/CDA1 family)